MPIFWDIRYLPGRETRKHYQMLDILYRLKDGTTFPVCRTLAWCRQCQDVTEGEVIDPFEFIEALIADYDNPASERYKRIMEQFKPNDEALGAKMIVRLRSDGVKRRRWRRSRISAPKCLVCGATDIQAISSHEMDNKLINVGTCKIRIVGGGFWSGTCTPRYYSSEGDRLPY